MAQLVTMNAKLMCNFGAVPSNLIVPPLNKTIAEGMPVANIMDYDQIKNYPPFGMCKAPTNPAVIEARKAASGILTPVPCLPSIAAPWVPGSPTVTIGGMRPSKERASACAPTLESSKSPCQAWLRPMSPDPQPQR